MRSDGLGLIYKGFRALDTNVSQGASVLLAVGDSAPVSQHRQCGISVDETDHVHADGNAEIDLTRLRFSEIQRHSTSSWNQTPGLVVQRRGQDFVLAQASWARQFEGSIK